MAEAALAEETVEETEEAGEEVTEEATEAEATEEAQETTEEAPDWRTFVGDEYKSTAERFNTIDDALKAVNDLRQKVSTAIVKPGEDASEEEIAEFNKALGVPESPDDYEFTPPEELELTEEDKEAQAAWAKLFHQHGVSKEAAKSLTDQYYEMMLEATQGQLKADADFAEETEAQLKQEWGKDYDTNMEYANRGAEYVFGDEFSKAREIEMKNGRFLLDHPFMSKHLAKIGRETSDSGLGPSVMTEETLQTKKDELSDLKNKQHEAYFSGRRDEADRLQPKIDKLAEEIGGTGPLVGADNRTL